MSGVRRPTIDEMLKWPMVRELVEFIWNEGAKHERMQQLEYMRSLQDDDTLTNAARWEMLFDIELIDLEGGGDGGV